MYIKFVNIKARLHILFYACGFHIALHLGRNYVDSYMSLETNVSTPKMKKMHPKQNFVQYYCYLQMFESFRNSEKFHW